MYIGIDLGGTNIAVGLVNENGELIAKESTPTNAQRPAEEIIRSMAQAALSVTEKAGVKAEDIRWAGIGSPGVIDREQGVLLYANNLPFDRTPMRAFFQKTWDIPVYIDNDANCAALGEAYAGSAKGCKNAIMITLGTGVGGGIIIDRRIYAGFNGTAGELGHMVIHTDGESCTCGRNGCWEAYASVNALIAQTKRAMQAHPDSLMCRLTEEGVNGRTAFDAAKQGDAAAQAVVDRYFAYVAEGVTNLINIFAPEILTIGGGISREGDYLLAPVKKKVEHDSYMRFGAMTELRIATLGNDAGIIGAAMLGK